MKIQTINQLVSVWKDIATRHYQINGFGVGESWEVGADKAYLHPVLWINPVSASMPSSDNGYKTFEIHFEVILFDLVDKDESNENHVLSDTIDILKDIITEFKGHPYYVNSQLNIINDIDFEAFTEEFDEEVSGWLCEISLMTPVLTSFCGIPSAEITGFEFPSVDCPDINVLCPVFVEEVTGVYPIIVTNIGTTRQVSLDPSGISNVNLVSTNFVGNTLTCLMSDGTIITADIDNFNGLSVAGTVDATAFTGDGSLLTGIQSDKLSSIGFVGNTLTATLTDGTVLTTSVDNFNGLTVNGTVGATSFTGDGSLLTGISSGNPVVSSSFSNNILSLTLQDATVINATINTFDDLTINGELVQHISTTPTPDVNLLNDSLVLHIEGSNTLAGRYKDNLGVVRDLSIGENIGNTDLVQVDEDRSYTIPSLRALIFGGVGGVVRLQDAIKFKMFNGDSATDSNVRFSVAVGSNTSYLDFNNGRTHIRTVGDSLTLTSHADNPTFTAKVILSADVTLKTSGSRSVKLKTANLFFQDVTGNTTYGRVDDDVFIWGGTAPISNEKFSIQGDTLIEGSLSIKSTTSTTKNLGFTSSATTPTTTEYPNDKDSGFHKNTGSGDLYLVFNDGGVVKKVTLT